MHRDKKWLAAIGRELKIKVDTARKIWNQLTQNRLHVLVESRPKKLNNRDQRHLKRYVKRNCLNRREPLRDISSTLNLNVHPNTLRKELVAFGLGHRKQRKRPYLSQKQKKTRLRFAKEHIHWTMEDWRRVIFSDEMALQTGANEGVVWVWRSPGVQKRNI